MKGVWKFKSGDFIKILVPLYTGGSQTLINLAQKYEESRKNQKIAQDFAQKMNNGRRFSDLVPVPYQPTAVAPPMSFQPTTQQSGIFFTSVLNIQTFEIITDTYMEKGSDFFKILTFCWFQHKFKRYCL